MRETPSVEREPSSRQAGGVPPPALLRSPGAIAALQRSIGNAATCRLLRAADDAFDDDPLAATDDGGSIRIKPGPVRTTLIESNRLRGRDGDRFDLDDHREPGAWIEAFLRWAGFDWVLSPTSDAIKYVLRHIDDKFYDLPAIVQLVVYQGALAGQTLDPGHVEAVAASIARPIAPSASASRTTPVSC